MERLKSLWLLLAASTLLLAAVGAAIAAEPGHAQICSPVCFPEEEEAPPPPPPPTPAPGPIKHRVLVVNVGWGSGASANDAPLRASVLPEYVDHINGFVNDWFLQSAPPGAFPGWTATAGGSYTIPQPNLPSSCTDGEELSFIGSMIALAQVQLERAGIDYSHYNLVAVVYSKNFCFAGVQASNRVLLASKRATIHEFGHYLGLAESDNTHPRALRCKDASGSAVPLSTSCEAVESGDPFEMMSTSGGLSFNPVYAKQLGWLNNQFFDVKAPATGTRTIGPFIGAGQPGSTVRAIRLQDGATTLWIEYRRPLGIDGIAGSPLIAFKPGSGVFIRREVSRGDVPISELLDMTPTSDISRPSLEPGETWANPLGEATITLNQVSPAGAVITIGNQRTATVPNVIGLTPDHAAAVISGAGLRSHGFTSVFDFTCGLLGVIAQQSPSPGAKVFPNSEVTLRVGERHPEIPCQ